MPNISASKCPTAVKSAPDAVTKAELAVRDVSFPFSASRYLRLRSRVLTASRARQPQTIVSDCRMHALAWRR